MMLREAAANGQLELVRSLLVPCSTTREDALRDAAEAGHLDVVKLLQRDLLEVRRNNMYPFPSELAMCEAARCGHLEVVQVLQKNCRPHACDHAIFQAAIKGHVHVVTWLLGCPDREIASWVVPS